MGPIDTCWATCTKMWGETYFRTPKVCAKALMCTWTNSPGYRVTKLTFGSIEIDSWFLVRKVGLPEPKLGSNNSRWHSSLIYAFWILNTKVWYSTSECGDKSEHLHTKCRFPSIIFLAVYGINNSWSGSITHWMIGQIVSRLKTFLQMDCERSGKSTNKRLSPPGFLETICLII